MRIRAGIGALKLRRYMIIQQVNDEVFQRFGKLMPPDDDLAEINERISRMEFQIDTAEYPESIRWRIERVLSTCHPNPVACTAVELACLQYMDAAADELLSFLFPSHKNGIRLLEALKITYPGEEYIDHMPELVGCTEILPLFLHIDVPSSELLFVGYRAESALAAFLSGGHWVPPLLQGCFKLILPEFSVAPLILNQETVSEITDYIRRFFAMPEARLFPVIQLTGPALTGKRFIVRHCAKELGMHLVFIHFHQFMDCGDGDFILKREMLIRQAALYGAAVCLTDVSFANPLFRDRLIQLVKKWPLCNPFFITATEHINLVNNLKNSVLSISMKKPDSINNLTLWQEMAKRYLPGRDFNALEVADKLPLPAGLVKRAVEAIALSPEKYVTISDISRLCYSMLETESVPSLKRVETSYTMDQLKLNKTLKDTIQSICDRILNRMQVFDIWEMHRLYPYGRCISVLFTGPPGTGKTMAASVIANTVNMELYRVDLSQLLDRYVGETEKRLEKVFAHGERSNCILFFDEADAIFGKRSVVSDSNDRYANAQVSFLLQRIEEYDGIVIMASNYRDNIDSAFTRRIGYILDFTIPDQVIRKEIWQSLFIDTMEYEELDFDFLSEHFEISGAMIKNIVLKAAFFAVNQKQPISMEHICMALIQEYSKIGVPIHKEELGEYGYLL